MARKSQYHLPNPDTGEQEIHHFETELEMVEDMTSFAQGLNKQADAAAVRSHIGLGNVDNTADSAKRVAYADNAGTVNGHTVSKDVPADAKLTDTTYDVMTSSELADGTSTQGKLIDAHTLAAFILTVAADVVNNAPEALDTLAELAQALGNDPNFATTVMTEIGKKLDKSGGVVTGNLTVNGTFTGNVIGNVSGSSGSCTGNAATATNLQSKYLGTNYQMNLEDFVGYTEFRVESFKADNTNSPSYKWMGCDVGDYRLRKISTAYDDKNYVGIECYTPRWNVRTYGHFWAGQWQGWEDLVLRAHRDGNNNDIATTYLPKSGGTITGGLDVAAILGVGSSGAEGGEIHLKASTDRPKENGIVLDQCNNLFRVFGIPSADGTTRVGVGTPLNIDPYSRTITGGYTFTGNVTGTAANVTGTVAIGHGGTGATTAAAARQNFFGDNLASSGQYLLAITDNWAKGGYVPVGNVKSLIGLGNVNNTADANKSVSYATTSGTASALTGTATITPEAASTVNTPSAGGKLHIKAANTSVAPNNGVILEFGNVSTWAGQLYLGDNADLGMYWNGWSNGVRGSWKKIAFTTDNVASANKINGKTVAVVSSFSNGVLALTGLS